MREKAELLMQFIQQRFRIAIEEQINEFRDNAFGGNEIIKCAMTGYAINRWLCHIDHVYPFANLVYDFFALTIPNNAEELETTFKEWDNGIVTSWQAYHQQRAILRAVWKQYNLTRSKPRMDWHTLFGL